MPTRPTPRDPDELAWDMNVQAVQDAKANLHAARLAYGSACIDHGRAWTPPMRLAARTGTMTPAQAERLGVAEQAVADAVARVTQATAALMAAQARFKAGVTDEQRAAAQRIIEEGTTP